MSNQAFIQQRTITLKCNGEQHQEIYICDGYGSGSIDLAEYCDSFYDDELELLRTVLDIVFNEESTKNDIIGIFDHIEENERGMYIEGTFYDWEDLKPVFKEFEKIEF